MTNQNAQIAKTILEQLGGNKFLAMTGAHSLSYDTNCLIFKLRSGAAKGIKAVRITLDPSDTYTMTFFSQKKFDVKTVAEHKDVYCDMLADLFTQETGLLTSLVSFG